jgi:hypothetical protein
VTSSVPSRILVQPSRLCMLSLRSFRTRQWVGYRGDRDLVYSHLLSPRMRIDRQYSSYRSIHEIHSVFATKRLACHRLRRLLIHDGLLILRLRLVVGLRVARPSHGVPIVTFASADEPPAACSA